MPLGQWLGAGVEVAQPGAHVGRRVFLRLHPQRVADLLDAHFGGGNAQLGRQADGLAAAAHEKLGAEGGHGRFRL